MGAAPSKIDDDKALVLCHERKRFVREALDGRCSLAAAHFSYIESLRNTGVALRMFAEPGYQTELSMSMSTAMSTSATQDLVQKAVPHFSNSSPLSNQHVEMTDSFSPSPISAGQFHVHHMKAGRMASRIVQEKPPVTMTATLELSSPGKPVPPTPDPEEGTNYESQIHVNHMKAGRMTWNIMREKPPANMSVALESSSPAKPVPPTLGPEVSTDYEVPSPPPPGTPPWDYFGLELFQPVDDRYTLDNGHGIDHNDIRRLREEEGIPELEEEAEQEEEEEEEEEEVVVVEEEGEEDKEEQDVEQNKEKLPSGDVSGDDFGDTDEDDFDKSSEPSVRMFKNHNLMANHDSLEDLGSDIEPHNIGPNIYETDESRTATPIRVFKNREVEDFGSDMELQENGEQENNMSHVGTEESHTRTPVPTPPRFLNQNRVNPPVANGNAKEHARNGPRNFVSCLKDIEELFIKAAESGREVPRMLEADKVQFRPLTADEIGRRAGPSTFLMSFLTCCVEEPLQPQASAPVDMKYLTWYRSVSSLSSSSKIPIEEPTKENLDSINSYVVGGVYMNSGSHASTLDRLYAWERKLYDEVKASGTIRRDYDFKCKLLRQQESQAESQQRIDKTRAAVKDLHSRIRVAIQRIDRISKTIEEIRDKELQPQLEELIEGLIRMWVVMDECHRHQLDLIQNASANGSIKFPNQPELQNQAALILSHELNLLSTNFTKWLSAQESYLQSINAWILKCFSPLEQKQKRKKKPQKSPRELGAPPIFVTCEEWLRLLKELLTGEVVQAVKHLANVTNHFAPHQEKGIKSFKSSLSLPRIDTSGGSFRIENRRRIQSFKNSLSLPRNDISGESFKVESMRSYDSPLDWRSNCESFRSSLVGFLDRLADFAHKSLDEYQNLKKTIDDAKVEYENHK